jgi:hypothetical protein
VNTGGGGGGGYFQRFENGQTIGAVGGAGGSGVVIIRYSALARVIDKIAPGLTFTYSNDGFFHRYVFTAGSGNITF